MVEFRRASEIVDFDRDSSKRSPPSNQWYPWLSAWTQLGEKWKVGEKKWQGTRNWLWAVHIKHSSGPVRNFSGCWMCEASTTFQLIVLLPAHRRGSGCFVHVKRRWIVWSLPTSWNSCWCKMRSFPMRLIRRSLIAHNDTFHANNVFTLKGVYGSVLCYISYKGHQNSPFLAWWQKKQLWEVQGQEARMVRQIAPMRHA